MALVFQYGSNTSSGRLNSAERLRGDAKDLGLVQTALMYDLTFDVWSRQNDCAAANLTPSGSRRVFGVLYKVPDDLMSRETAGSRRSFDAIEGDKYQRCMIEVTELSGNPVTGPVTTYLVRNPQAGLRTAAAYAEQIVHGLRDHGAPDAYIRYVKGQVVVNNPTLRDLTDAW